MAQAEAEEETPDSRWTGKLRRQRGSNSFLGLNTLKMKVRYRTMMVVVMITIMMMTVKMAIMMM